MSMQGWEGWNTTRRTVKFKPEQRITILVPDAYADGCSKKPNRRERFLICMMCKTVGQYLAIWKLMDDLGLWKDPDGNAHSNGMRDLVYDAWRGRICVD